MVALFCRIWYNIREVICMKLRDYFEFGRKRILAQNFTTKAVVTRVKCCRWFRVNTKSVRRYSGDGSVYPHIIAFRYQIGGTEYEGEQWIPWYKQPPEAGTEITIHVDPDNHERNAYDTSALCPSVPAMSRLH